MHFNFLYLQKQLNAESAGASSKSDDNDIVVVGAVRTPIAKANRGNLINDVIS